MAGGSDADTLPPQAQPPAAAGAAAGAGTAAVAAPPPAAAPAEPAAALQAAIAAEDLEYRAEVQAGIALFRRLAAQLDGGGPEPDWEPLRGRPGFCLEPISWARLAALIAQGGPRALGTLGRTPMQLRAYYQRRDEVLRQFATVTDYLRHHVFGLGTAPGPDGRLLALAPPGFFAAGGDGPATVVWRDNDFPYYVEPGIAHYNLWASRPLAPAELRARIAAHVPPGAEALHFVNPPVLQSVPGIWHAHIFVRDGQRAEQQAQQQQTEQRQQQQRGQRQASSQA